MKNVEKLRVFSFVPIQRIFVHVFGIGSVGGHCIGANSQAVQKEHTFLCFSQKPNTATDLNCYTRIMFFCGHCIWANPTTDEIVIKSVPPNRVTIFVFVNHSKAPGGHFIGGFEKS